MHGTDGHLPLAEAVRWGRGLASRVGSPAEDGAVAPQSASVVWSHAELAEGAFGRRGVAVVPPARERAVRPQPAAVAISPAYLDEGDPRGGRIACSEQPNHPAGAGAVGPDPAGVAFRGVDLAEGAGGVRRGLRRIPWFVPPAVDRAVAPQPAGEDGAGADLGEGAGGGGVGLPVVVRPPAGQRAVGFYAAGVLPPTLPG